MKTLTLSIKQQYFDEILAGTKKEEYREIRPNNGKRYFLYDCGGKLYEADQADDMPEDVEVGLVPKKYDAIKFLTGAYVGKRPWALVEVTGADIEILTDEDGNDLVYEWTDGKEYVAAQMVYHLGKVLERS